MKTFKKIVLATDFSDNAATTFHYAHHVASRLKAALHVVNVYEIPINTSETQYFDVTPSIEQLADTSNARLSHFLAQQKQEDESVKVISRVKITSEAMVGFPADRLIEISKDPSVDLMVLGSSGEHSWLDKVFGSVAVEVSVRAHCPVLIVPRQAQYQGLHHFLYAASFDSAVMKDIHIAIDWTKYFMGDINFLHVNTVGDAKNHAQQEIFEDLLRKEKTKIPFSFDTIRANSIPDGIKEYVEDNLIDLIFVVTRHRTFWENMTHASVTKALAWNSHIPIMVLHSDDKEQPPA